MPKQVYVMPTTLLLVGIGMMILGHWTCFGAHRFYQDRFWLIGLCGMVAGWLTAFLGGCLMLTGHFPSFPFVGASTHSERASVFCGVSFASAPSYGRVENVGVDTFEEAVAAREEMEKTMFGEYAADPDRIGFRSCR